MSLHPENIRVGMKIIATGLISHASLWADMDYAECMEKHADYSEFRRLAGVPLLVMAIHYPYVIVQYKPLDTAALYGDKGKSEERPLDLRRYVFDRIGRKYASRLKPVTPEMEWQEANRVIDEAYRKAGQQRPGT